MEKEPNALQRHQNRATFYFSKKRPQVRIGFVSPPKNRSFQIKTIL